MMAFRTSSLRNLTYLRRLRGTRPEKRLLTTVGPNCLLQEVPHFRKSPIPHPLEDYVDGMLGRSSYTLPHPIWTKDELENIAVTHEEPKTKVDKLAYLTVRSLRGMFDVFSGYAWGKVFGSLDESKWLRRIIFLETVAAVPGMVAAMTRHLRSLRQLQRDHGWIHTLLEEAENERMHLLTALDLKNPSFLFRSLVITSQGMFLTSFWLAYLISPRFCHRFVGYLEEEAVKTYTHCLEGIDDGSLKMWGSLPAPAIAKNYWQLEDGAMMRDVVLVIRADEAHHRLVNHTLSDINTTDSNPYQQPAQKQ